MATQLEFFGLGDAEQREWPKATPAELRKPAIELLAPRTKRHQLVLDYLLKRLEFSEQAMSNFYSRWQVAERKVQAYITLADWEKQLKNMNDAGNPPKITSIQVPYTFAALQTVQTFLIHTFVGRKPMMQIGTYKDETVEAARMMETVLQFNADHTKLPRHLFQVVNDGQLYGTGILRTNWKELRAMRTTWHTKPPVSIAGLQVVPGRKIKTREEHLIYQGNEAFAQDPFMFFPDPRVPMVEIPTRGEFVFWRTFDGKHSLLKDEDLRWVKYANLSLPRNRNWGDQSVRDLVTMGTAHPGFDAKNWIGKGDFMQRDEGTIEIIPQELGLGESEKPEKWLFTILNKSQIVQARPLGLDHDQHPVAVQEPYTMGYGFGQLGLVDYLGQLQDQISWLINSHMDNVRRVLNDMFVVDPSMVEMQDFEEGKGGGIVRLKRAAFGQDVRTAIQQIPMQDVTAQHVKDAETFFRIGELLSAATENIMGRQQQGGRKTATESRISGESSASRLAAMARLISTQQMTTLAEQWTLNLQQNLEDEFYLEIVGTEGLQKPIHITPDMLVGDFHFPIHDGTLPLDKIALLDVWRQIFQAVVAEPELRQTYSVPKLFEFIAELGGAKNIEGMRKQGSPQMLAPQVMPMPDQKIEQQVQAGNMVPASGLVNAMAGRPQAGGFPS